VLQLPEVQEFVAEARERHALMTAGRARRYQRGCLCSSENGEIWYGNPAHAQGAELVRRFVEQVYIPQKYENGDWRRATGQEAEYLFRRSILSEIGELRCRDLKAEHLRAVLRKLAGTGLSYEPVSKVRFAMGDMVKRMVAEEYLTFNIAVGLKTPKTARRSDRSRLRRVTLAEYVQARNVLDERERLACDLVTFCGLRESEAYGLKNGDLFQHGAIRVQRSWYKGDINPTKTDEIRKVGVGAEIFERLIAWIATLPDGNDEGWVFPSEQIVTPLLPDNVLRRCIHPRSEPLGLDWINFAVLRRSHSTLHEDRGTNPKILRKFSPRARLRNQRVDVCRTPGVCR
jgi:site-specific recombinase XerC